MGVTFAPVGKTIILALCFLVSTPSIAANAINVHGQWKIEVPSQPTYVGQVMIDAEQRATWASPRDTGKPARFVGYVATNNGAKVEIALTNGDNVARAHCTAESNDVMHCYLAFTDRPKISAPFILRRSGPGPQKLTGFQ